MTFHHLKEKRMTAPTTTFQISDRRGEAILLVKTEGLDPDATYQAFGAAVQDAGLDGPLNGFGTGLVQAVTNAQPLVGAQGYVQQPPPQQYAPQVPAAAQGYAAPAAQPGTGVCQHGAKTYKSGTTNGRDWAFWGCNARSNDPTKCEKEWA